MTSRWGREQKRRELEAREAAAAKYAGDPEHWLYFADGHVLLNRWLDGQREECRGGGENVPFAWPALTGDLSDSGMTPAPRSIEVGPCGVCGQIVEVSRRS